MVDRSSSFSPGDRVVLEVDVPTAGLRAGDLVWVRSAGERLSVMKADGEVVAAALEPSQVRAAAAGDVASAAGVRPPASKEAPKWLTRVVQPIAAVLLLILLFYKWRQRENARPPRPEPPKVQRAPLPRERYNPPPPLLPEGR